MAQLTQAQEVIGTGRFESFLRRLLSVKGTVAPTVEPKLQAGFDILARPEELCESALLAGWRGYSAYGAPTPGAAEYCAMELRNVATGIICVIPYVTIYASVAQQVTCGIRDSRPVGMSAVTDIGSLDSRYGSIASVLSAPAAKPFAGRNNTALGLLPTAVNCPVGQNVIIPGPWILADNNSSATFQILSLVANQNLQAVIVWYERQAEPSERAAR